MITLFCQQCGKEFQVKKSYYEYQKKHGHEIKFCSRMCYYAFRGFDKRIVRICKNCGKEFSIRFSKANKYINFCSRNCRMAWFEKQRLTKTCKNCGATFSTIPSKTDCLFCSRTCFSMWQSTHAKPNKGSFKKGHIPWNNKKKDIHLSLETEFKNGTLHPFWGKNLSEDHRRKISDFQKEYSNQIEVKKHRSKLMKGRQHIEETKQKIRKARLRQVFPAKDTSIEVALQSELDRRGIVYSKHLPVCGICQPDIVFPNQKIALFADGDYWHTKDERAIKKDQYQNKILKNAGWNVLRFWGHEIRENVVQCVDKVEYTLAGMK